MKIYISEQQRSAQKKISETVNQKIKFVVVVYSYGSDKFNRNIKNKFNGLIKTERNYSCTFIEEILN